MDDAPPVASRTRRSARNAGVGVLGQGVVLVLGFLSRTVFVNQLGVELLGVQSLLVSVLAIVAVADAGVSWALMYSLYEPLHAGDQRRVAAIVRQAAVWYRWIAVGTACIGLLILPFLDLLVDLEDPVEHLNLYFLVLLAGMVMQYPMYHRVTLLAADQKAYWTNSVTIAVNVARSVLQIAVLVLWQDFLLFLALQAVAAVVVNAIVYRHVGRRYRYLSLPGSLEPDARREVGSSVRAMLVYRISGLALNNTDPILISVLLGTVVLGYYANYLLIIGSVLMILEVAFSALTPSVGNLVASGDAKAIRGVLDELQLLTIGLYGTSAVAMLLTLQEVVRIWLGESFVLSDAVLLAAVANFYLFGVMTPIFNFRGATGMFREARYVLLVTAVLNLVLSVLLGNVFGLPGILFATLIARLLTSVWIEPMLLFRRYVSGGARSYARIHVIGVSVICGTYLALQFLLDRLAASDWSLVLIGGLVAGIAVPMVIGLTFGRTAAWRATTQRLTGLLRR